MKRLAIILITVGCVSSLLCHGEAACQKLVVRSRVEAAPGELSLADLLAPGTCPQWYRWARRVSLGAVPRAGSERVLEGEEIRRLIRGIGDRGPNLSSDDQKRIPERIVVRQARAVKSCAEIARVVSRGDPAQAETTGGRELSEKDVDCAAAGNIPEDAPLELVTAKWNAGLQRREFALRCGHREDCIPFLVWVRADTSAVGSAQFFPRKLDGSKSGWKEAAPLIKIGQTVMLTWDEAGIRVVLPVICLEAGAVGQRVRVRFKNAARTLQAEIVGAGMVRASL
ncbi:MAG: flagella basal body P-ring formation protein FlgA [Candidatus Sulfotelmatobacter sp.]